MLQELNFQTEKYINMTSTKVSRSAFTILLALVAVAAGAGASPYEFQQQLHMVSHKGHELAFYVTAGRLPAIVLDAGGGNSASYWTVNSTIAADLAKKTGSMIITYDRSGMGLSEYVPGPWKPKKAAGDLKAGLRALSVTDHRSVILVSHSVAGEVATYFARSSPHWISGAVLVDASLPEFFTDSVVAKFVAAYTPEIAALKNQASNYSTLQLLAYVEDFGPVHRAFHKVSWPKRVPAIAIVSSETPFPGDPVDAQLWRDAQAQFVRQAPEQRTLVVAANSSHDIPIDRPNVVIQAVEDMLDKVEH